MYESGAIPTKDPTLKMQAAAMRQHGVNWAAMRILYGI